MKLKRMLALVLTIAMVLSVAVFPVSAADVTYTDVADNHWAESSIYRWTDAGVLYGCGDGTFAPDRNVTRAEVAQVLSKILGLTELTENTYSDVTESDWFYKAIMTCSAARIMVGYGNGLAGATDNITREQLFNMVVNSLQLDGEATEILESFPDYKDVADWALDETLAILSYGVIAGREVEGKNLLAPQGILTRAELVAVLDRLIAAYVDAEGNISLTSKAKVGSIVVVNANCPENVEIKAAGDSAVITVANGKTATITPDNGKVVVVIVNEDSAEVTATQTVQVIGATDEEQAHIEVIAVEQPEPECEHPEESLCYINFTGCCAAGQEYEIYCEDCETVIGTGKEEPTTHVFDEDGICAWCGEDKNDDAQKFYLGVESGAKVYANVTDDYAAELVVEQGQVDASEVTVSAKMNNVASLGGGVKAHEITVKTDLANKPSLESWLSNAWKFESANVTVNVAGTDSFEYYVSGEKKDVNDDLKLDAVITAEPSNVAAARAAWQEITSHVTTTTQATDDSKIIIANGSTLQVGTETLKFEDGAGNLVLDNFNNLDALKDTIKDHVVLVAAADDKIEIVAGAGTTLAVGQSVATLNDVCTITVTGVEDVDGVLSALQTAAKDNSTYAILSNLVNLVNEVIGGADGAEVTVDISFAECQHTSAPVAVEGNCASGVEVTCSCGKTYDLAPAAHDFEDGTCTVCGTTEEAALKFALSVEAGEGSVAATVTDDYVAVISGNYTKVDPSAVTLTAKMQNVGSLGVNGVREHSVTINTGLSGDPDLSVWLSNVVAFQGATVKATIDGKAVTYVLDGDAGTIVAAPTEVAEARAAWAALTANVATSTGADDSKIIIANGSSLQIAGEKLVFEGTEDLVLDNFSDMDALEAEIRENVKLVEGEDTLVAVLKKGTTLAVGSSVATLEKDATITITGLNDVAGLDGILTALKNAESTQVMAEKLVKLVNEVVGAANGATVNVDITFA